jgi:hypothetical protein
VTPVARGLSEGLPSVQGRFGIGQGVATILFLLIGLAGVAGVFLIMLVTLAVCGLLLLRARRSYLTDVATACASEQSVREQSHSRVAHEAVGASGKL